MQTYRFMGIVILPFLLGAIIVSFIATFKIVRLIILKEINILDIFYGFLTSITLYTLIALCYFILDEAWALSPPFILTIIMIYIPFIFHLRYEKSNNPKEVFITKIILFSIVLTTLLAAIFSNIFFNIIDHVGTHKSY